MARNGLRDEESISVLTDPSSPEEGAQGGDTGIPEFHMYTGSYEGDASHYALSLSHKVLQKRNRELEHQVVKLQRENNKIKSKKKSSVTEDSSISPTNTMSTYRSRGMAPDAPAPENILNSGETTKAMEEFTNYLQKQLEKSEMEKRDLASRLDQVKARCHTCEQRNKDISKELEQAQVLVAQKSDELEMSKNNNENQKLMYNQLTSQLEEYRSQNSSFGTLHKKVKELEAKLFRVQGENSTMQQLYEDTISKNELLEKSIQEHIMKHKDLVLKTGETNLEFEKLKKINSDLVEQIKTSEKLNTYYQEKLDREASASAQTREQNASSSRKDPEDDNNDLMEDAREDIVTLQSQILEMHSVIRTQTVMIQELGKKLRQRSLGSLTGLGTSSPPSPPQGLGARPRVPNTPQEHEQRRTSPENQRPPQDQGVRRSPNPTLISSPVACHEDLMSLDEEELRTMIGISAEEINRTKNTGNNMDLRSPAKDVGPGHDPFVRPLSYRPSEIPMAGIVVNGDHGPVLPNFNFQTQAVVGGNYGHHTEPIVRLPPTIQPERRSVTAPIATRTSPPRASAGNQTITAETNSSRRVTEPYRNHGNQEQTIPSNHGNIYTRPRVPTEQSDHIVTTPKECPVCNKKFPNYSQEAFELHVNQCLTSAESSPPPTREQPEGVGEGGDILECPVCSQIYPPTSSQAEFQQHVDGHFVEENFEVLGQQRH